MIVGIPREVMDSEFRVAITPAGVRELTSAGHRVLVEHAAGEGSSIPDDRFVATGATIVADAAEIWSDSDMVLKVKEPAPEEYPALGARRRSSRTCELRNVERMHRRDRRSCARLGRCSSTRKGGRLRLL